MTAHLLQSHAKRVGGKGTHAVCLMYHGTLLRSFCAISICTWYTSEMASVALSAHTALRIPACEDLNAPGPSGARVFKAQAFLVLLTMLEGDKPACPF